MDIVDLERKHAEENEKDVLIFNPLKEDFQGKWDGEEKKAYLIPSKENKSFKSRLAKHFGKHLVDAYLNTKDKNYSREKAEKLVFPND